MGDSSTRQQIIVKALPRYRQIIARASPDRHRHIDSIVSIELLHTRRNDAAAPQEHAHVRSSLVHSVLMPILSCKVNFNHNVKC